MHHAAALVALALSMTGCLAPSQHDETRYHAVPVWFGPEEWASSYRDVWRAYLPALSTLGPTVREASGPAEPDARTVVHFDGGPPACAGGGARTALGGRLIELDPACLPGELMLRAALGHEIGHTLGMLHVRHRAGDDCADCGPTEAGEALMNPGLVYGDPGASPDFGHAFTGGVPQDTPTDLDLAEFRRVQP